MEIKTSLILQLTQILKILEIMLLECIDAQPLAIDQDHHTNVPDCGKVPIAPTSRIINGLKAKEHYPWVVRVLRYYDGQMIESCGGSIVTKRSEAFVIFCTYSIALEYYYHVCI